MREDIIKSADKIFKLNTIYKRKEIEALFKKNETSFINITAYTYNRWNKGMNEIIEIFEYLGRDNYKFIGTKEISKYSGPVFHNPIGENHEYKIGNWEKGAHVTSFPLQFSGIIGEGLRVYGRRSKGGHYY